MPAGVPFRIYAKFASVSLLSMLAGSQTVNWLYNPLADFQSMVEARKEEIKKEEVKTETC